MFIWGAEISRWQSQAVPSGGSGKPVFGPINVELACYLTDIGGIAVSMLLIMNSELIPEWFVGTLGIAVFLNLISYALVKLSEAERNQMFAAIYFVPAQIPF